MRCKTQTLGLLVRQGSKTGLLEPSALSLKNPSFMPRLTSFMKKHRPDVTFTTVQVNMNTISKPHLDGGNNGKYSKRRRSNVAVIIVRVIFISPFLFYCLLLNHSFQTNPNSITNCFELFSLLQLTTTLLLRRFFDF